MTTPEQALEGMTRENQRLGLYDDVLLPEPTLHIGFSDSYASIRCWTQSGAQAQSWSAEEKRATTPYFIAEDLRDYGQQCARAARLAALEEVVILYSTDLWMLDESEVVAAIRALAAAEVAK